MKKIELRVDVFPYDGIMTIRYKIKHYEIYKSKRWYVDEE